MCRQAAKFGILYTVNLIILPAKMLESEGVGYNAKEFIRSPRVRRFMRAVVIDGLYIASVLLAGRSILQSVETHRINEDASVAYSIWTGSLGMPIRESYQLYYAYADIRSRAEDSRGFAVAYILGSVICWGTSCKLPNKQGISG